MAIQHHWMQPDKLCVMLHIAPNHQWIDLSSSLYHSFSFIGNWKSDNWIFQKLINSRSEPSDCPPKIEEISQNDDEWIYNTRFSSFIEWEMSTQANSDDMTTHFIEWKRTRFLNVFIWFWLEFCKRFEVGCWTHFNLTSMHMLFISMFIFVVHVGEWNALCLYL